MKRLTMVEVRWVDSAHVHDWRRRRDAEHFMGVATCTSVGFLVADEPEYVTIAQSIDDEVEDHQGFDALLSIPRVAVKSIRRMRPKR